LNRPSCNTSLQSRSCAHHLRSSSRRNYVFFHMRSNCAWETPWKSPIVDDFHNVRGHWNGRFLCLYLVDLSRERSCSFRIYLLLFFGCMLCLGRMFISHDTCLWIDLGTLTISWEARGLGTPGSTQLLFLNPSKMIQLFIMWFSQSSV
jgi:hypothetical protein